MKGTLYLISACLRFALFSLIGAGLITPTGVFARENSTSSNFDLTCSHQVNVNLQGDCQATLNVETLLLGDKTGIDFGLYTIVVKDDDTSNGGIVDGCGTYVYEISGPDDFGCWGNVTAEDKTPVDIECPSEISGYWDEYGFVPFLCSDLDTLLITGVAEYTTDANGNVLEISDELKRILDITGYPTIYENCGNVTIRIRDEVIKPEDDCEPDEIKRTFTAYNNSCLESEASCMQKLSFYKPTYKDVDLPYEIELECSDDFATDENGNPKTPVGHTHKTRDVYRFRAVSEHGSDGGLLVRC